jgi:hypothetical protein
MDVEKLKKCLSSNGHVFSYKLKRHPMNSLMKKVFFITLGLGSLASSMKAQTKYIESEFKMKPVWIKMMQDSTVNYNLAVKAFNIYWENRIRPGEESDKINEKEDRKEERARKRYEEKLTKMSPSERNEFDNINYQYKCFADWMYEVKPFVQQDGSILTPQQRIDTWNKQQARVKKQKKAD